MLSRCARVALACLAALFPPAAGPARAQATPALPTTPGAPAVACGPGNQSPACRDLRARTRDAARPGPAARSAQPSPAILSPPRPDMDDVRGQRLIPPDIARFLRDPRIDPLTRAYLTGIAGKRPEDWTVADLQLVTAVVPTLTEMRIGTAVLSEFYEFLGLDPANLFEPQLGSGWQTSSTTFDARNYGLRRECVNLSRAARVDPGGVRLQALVDCSGDGR